MANNMDEKELMILEFVSDSDKPIGSWALVERLEERGVNASSATIGRILNKLERMGYVKKKQFKGRVITDKGEEAIKIANHMNKIDYHKKRLDEYINTNVLENFIMVLEARLSIEKETARLAARHATPGEIEEMENVLHSQEKKYSEQSSIASSDIEFHRAIARASRNKVLESLYNIVSYSGQQSELFEYIRKKVNSPYMVSHWKILDSIKSHNEELAVECMKEHIHSLMEDVKKYWESYN